MRKWLWTYNPLISLISSLLLLFGCGRSEEAIREDLKAIEESGFRMWEGELAGEPRNAKGLENSDMVWFPFRLVYYSRGAPFVKDINKWPAIAPTGKYHKGDRVKMVTFGGEALYVVVGSSEPK